MTRFALLLLLALIFTSCTEEKTILLWSDRKEMADAAELYNKSGTEYRVVFQYKEELVSSFVDADVKPDIIIGRDLANKLIKSEMALIPDESAGKTITALRGGTELNGGTRLVPLSFSPETIIFRKESKRVDGNRPSLDLTEIKDLSTAYNDEKKRGYSPFWDRDFLLAVLDLYGSEFRSGEERTLEWNETELNEALSFLLQWNTANSEKGDLSLFDEKYLYDNRLKILKEERILFTTLTLGDFMVLSDAMSRDLNFLYISHEEMMQGGEIVYGGIYRKTGVQDKASHFLQWLMTTENQEMIIQSALSNRTGTFGFLGGLSSNNEVNTLIMPRFYPRLRGKIPEESFLLPGREKPEDYQSVKYDLLSPWLEEKQSGEEITLEQALEKWEKLRIPF